MGGDGSSHLLRGICQVKRPVEAVLRLNSTRAGGPDCGDVGGLKYFRKKVIGAASLQEPGQR